MATIQWRPAVNALTTPKSYRIQAVSRSTDGYDEMAADISAEQPIYSEETVKGLAPLIMQWIQRRLINGSQVTLPEAFSFYVSFTGKLDSPDAPLPEGDDLLQVNVRVSQPFVKEIRHQAKLERLPLTERVPVISSTEDTLLKLKDVLNPAGVLLLTGTDLAADPQSAGNVVIEGTRNGSAVQTRLLRVEPSEMLLMPDIPAQDNSWNNEYTVTVNARYSEHGTLRTGTCSRKLRRPLTVPLSGETGILSGDEASPLASVTGGTATANELLRIQALVDSRTGQLTLRLLDMQEGGRAGAAVAITEEIEYNVLGFSNSAVESLTIAVENLAGLISLTRDNYSGRLVDVLDVRIE
uniref:hypothetical protein n=1 Tax=Candidatus Electronema sp. TaxID=2698783 RepID=UPI004057B03D